MANVFDMLKQASQLKKQASQLQKILSDKIYEASSKDEKIKIKINGKMEVLSIDIASDILSPHNKTHLEKTILHTYQIARKEMERMVQDELKSRFGDLPFDKMPF
ncbi:MAG: YbaB/EbfC family nucleoid-associated protein [Candidatus Omnitrophica bacterium]|nr:YbaB/EbfC family nucleoid-associated protein [Candidatus Omnitrophota bacterium]